MNDFNDMGLAELWPIMKEQIDAGKSVRFKPGGRSMLPLVRPGMDTVLIKKAPEKLKRFDVPLYRRNNGQFVLHRVLNVKNGKYTMRGDNQNIIEREVTPEQILAIAEGVFKNDVYIPFSGVKYKTYCYLRDFRQKLSRVKRVVKREIKKIKNF